MNILKVLTHFSSSNMIINQNKCMNKSIIPCIKWLHWLSTVDSHNISSHCYNSWISSQTVCYTTYVSVPAVVVTPAKTTSNFTAVGIDLHHLIRHTQPVWTTTTCMITSSTHNTTTVMPPTVTDNELTHHRIYEQYFDWYEFIILSIN